MKRAISTARRRGRPPASEVGLVRTRLLASALDLFAKRGFRETSIHDIATASGVSDSALYAHFAGKRALYDALFEEAGPVTVARAIEKWRRETYEPARFVRGLVAELLALWSETRSRQFTSMFVRELAAGGFVRILQPEIDSAQGELAQVVAAWRAAGLVRSGTGDMQLAWELVSPLIYLRFVYLQAKATRNERQRAATLARLHADHFLEAIAAASGSKPASRV